MPLFYSDVPGAIQTTNAVANTTNDCFFVKPGTRTAWVHRLYAQGRGVNLTNISGITYRLVKWTSTSSAGGTALTPTPNDVGYQAAKHTAGWSASAVTPGTGGPLLMLSIGSGTTSQNPWQAPTPDEGYPLEGSANESIDVLNVSGAVSLSFELTVGVWE